MKKFSSGYKFIICSHDELIEKGWEKEYQGYFHDDFKGNCLAIKMLEYEGRILTVKNEAPILDWYIIQEDYAWTWPVATFTPAADIIRFQSYSHTCEEGMTELGGWFICKHCGTNLRQIIK